MSETHKKMFITTLFYDFSMPFHYCSPALCMERKKGRETPFPLPSLPPSLLPPRHRQMCCTVTVFRLPFPLLWGVSGKSGRRKHPSFYLYYYWRGDCFLTNFRLRPGQLTKSFCWDRTYFLNSAKCQKRGEEYLKICSTPQNGSRGGDTFSLCMGGRGGERGGDKPIFCRTKLGFFLQKQE